MAYAVEKWYNGDTETKGAKAMTEHEELLKLRVLMQEQQQNLTRQEEALKAKDKIIEAKDQIIE